MSVNNGCERPLFENLFLQPGSGSGDRTEELKKFIQNLHAEEEIDVKVN